MSKYIFLFMVCSLSTACSLDATQLESTEPTQQNAAEDRPASLATSGRNGEAHNAPTQMREEIRPFIKPGDALLAYKTQDLAGPNEQEAVAIVRHPKLGSKNQEEQNRCELLVLHIRAGASELTGKSSKIVDCVNNIFAKEIAQRPDDLNEYIDLNILEFAYTNQGDKSNTKYTFKYSKEKQNWYLDHAISNYSRPNMRDGMLDSVQERASYPKDIGFISIAAFDPDGLRDVLKKNRTVN